jgi:hypothetical protein
MDPETVTGELGEAPVICTCQVSPTCNAFVPPREVVKIILPPLAGALPDEACEPTVA